jgi:hypothetical protein
MDYEILRPFGPAIYKGTVSDNFLELLQKIAEQSKEEPEANGYRLAGNIKDQLKARIFNNQIDFFLDGLNEHIFRAMRGFNNLVKITEENIINYDLGGGPWINYQRAGEFNPCHRHSGDLSAIIYIDIPECIAEENVHLNIGTNMPSFGKVEFIHGDEGMFWMPKSTHQPKTGEIFIFPASLSHLVYPFKSDVERISMSFNVINIRVR